MTPIMPASLTHFADLILGNQCGTAVYINEKGYDVTLYVFPLHCAKVVVLAAHSYTADPFSREWDILHADIISEDEDLYRYLKPKLAELRLDSKV